MFGRNRTLIALLAFAATATAAVPAPRPIGHAIRTMGTYANVTIVAADSLATLPASRAASAVFFRVDSLMSNWTTTSEVARINRVAASGATSVHPEVARVLAASLRAFRESGGAFDITVEPLVRLWGFLGGPKRVPTDSEIATALARVGAARVHFDSAGSTIRYERDGVKVDLGGIAKGYAVDVAAETLAARGVANALVDLSGNMMALGSPRGGNPWRIGLRDPRGRLAHFASVTLADGDAISTSGQYEQFLAANGKTYGHILDPRTGRSVDGLISVTVVSRSALTCDTWDTPLFVLGPVAARRMAKARGLAVVLVEPGADGVDVVWVERSLRERFRLDPRAESLFRVEYF